MLIYEANFENFSPYGGNFQIFSQKIFKKTLKEHQAYICSLLSDLKNFDFGGGWGKNPVVCYGEKNKRRKIWGTIIYC